MNGLDDLGARIIAALGEPAAPELLDVLTRPDRLALPLDRAAATSIRRTELNP